ncbi:MAG: hypothetical protein V4850_10825 [Myxococcota bacterium]
MLSLLLLIACSFSTPDSGTPPSADDDDETPTETERGEASLVTILTDEIPMEEGEELEIPRNATLVRVDSCYDDSDEGAVCTTYAGTWNLYEDRFVLSPSSWDNEYARVVWMQVKTAE